MKLNYDNYEDAKSKLCSTYCLYDGKAFVVKTVDYGEPNILDFTIGGVNMVGTKTVRCAINDPKFNCSDYNIGYLNRGVVCAWWHRLPMKQYRQGLRYDQLGNRYSDRAYFDGDFKPGKQLANMLENVYPDAATATDLLKLGEAKIIAFHKNFAMTYDQVHQDFVLEYKGRRIGSTGDRYVQDFKLMPEFAHLTEALKEAVNS